VAQPSIWPIPVLLVTLTPLLLFGDVVRSIPTTFVRCSLLLFIVVDTFVVVIHSFVIHSLTFDCCWCCWHSIPGIVDHLYVVLLFVVVPCCCSDPVDVVIVHLHSVVVSSIQPQPGLQLFGWPGLQLAAWPFWPCRYDHCVSIQWLMASIIVTVAIQ